MHSSSRHTELLTTESPPDTICLVPKEYQLLRYIDMSDVYSVAAIELKGRDNTFGIVTPRRAYYVRASNRTEMQEWTRSLNEIKAQISQRNTITHDFSNTSISPQRLSSTSEPTVDVLSSAAAPGRSSHQQPSITAALTGNASMQALSTSINVPGKSSYINFAKPRPTSISGDAFSPLTVTTDSETGAEQYGLSYKSSAGYSHSLGSSPGRDANRSGSEASEGGNTAAASARRSTSHHSELLAGSRSGGSLRRSEASEGPLSGTDVGAHHSSSYQSSGMAVLSSSDEDEDDDEQLDRAMPLPSLAAAVNATHSQFTVTSEQDSENPAAESSMSAASAAQQSPDLLRYPDRIIMQSYLMKQSKGRKQWRKRWFVLTASRLVYTRSHMNKKALREVPISSILDAIEYTASHIGPPYFLAAGGSGGSPGVPSPLGGTFNLNPFMNADGSGRGQEWHSGVQHLVSQGGKDDEVASARADAPLADGGGFGAAPAVATSPPLRRQNMVAAAAEMASTLGAGVGLERDGSSKKRMDNCFKIITPKRVYLLCAPTEEEEIKWLSALQALLARTRDSKRPGLPMTACVETSGGDTTASSHVGHGAGHVAPSAMGSPSVHK